MVNHLSFKEKLKDVLVFLQEEKKDLDMIQYLFQKGEKKTFAQIGKLKKNKISHRHDAFVKIKKYFKFS